MSIQVPGPIISLKWVLQNYNSPHVKLLDASWYLPNQHGNAVAEFEKQHIEGAVFFDIEKISNPSNPLPHMLPSSKLFSEQMSFIGVSNSDAIIIYDSIGIFGY